MTNTSLLTVSALSCARGDNLLFANLGFALAEGECLHVIGANGSGKTSLLRIVAGLSQATHGNVAWHAQDVHKSLEYKSESAYIGHLEGLKPELTAFENLRFALQLDQTPHTSKSIDQDLKTMGILQCADLFANQLSFGQRRRLAFARLLHSSAKLWILDEPFTGVDDQGRQLIESLCAEHLSKGGCILLTNHRSLKTTSLGTYLRELNLMQYADEANSNEK